MQVTPRMKVVKARELWGSSKVEKGMQVLLAPLALDTGGFLAA